MLHILCGTLGAFCHAWQKALFCSTGRGRFAICKNSMRDYVNPLLLLIIVVLLACRVSGVGESGMLEVWILGVCVTAFVVNGALCLARLLTRRHALMSTVWAVVYLILGCCTWVLYEGRPDLSDEEQVAFDNLAKAYQRGESPFAVDADGDSYLTVAASLGKSGVVQKLLAGGAVPPEQLAEAARRAAENGRTAVLKQFLAAGVSVDSAIGGTTLLCAAAQNGRVGCVKLLLAGGANANLADEEGTVPLIHAVLADAAPVAQMLLQAGAEPTATDAAGRSAADYSRSRAIDSLFSSVRISD